MPFPIIIRRPVTVIDSPPPVKHDLCAQSSSEANLPGTAGDIDAVLDCQQQKVSSKKCQPISTIEGTISSSRYNSDGASSWSDIEEDIAELFPASFDDDDDAAIAPNQDIISQWDALYEREKHNVYVISDPHSVPEDQRVKLCNWSYAVVDKYEICRHTVSIAAAYFDRLVSNGWVERNEWSLASVTCLYLAVKINSTAGRVFEPALMAHECVYFSASQIIDMEDHICQVFDWYMNPPVPSQFVDIVASLLVTEPMHQTSLEDDDDIQGIVSIHDLVMRQDLLRHSHYLCELSVMDSFFSDKESSSVACASVMIAMDVLRFPPGAAKWFASLPLRRDPDETEECALRLGQIWFGIGEGGGGGAYGNVRTPSCEKQEASSSSSPEPRAVTPTKCDAPPDLKRMRRGATVEALNVEDSL